MVALVLHASSLSDKLLGMLDEFSKSQILYRSETWRSYPTFHQPHHLENIRASSDRWYFGLQEELAVVLRSSIDRWHEVPTSTTVL
jgi:hypothetical protein